MRLLWLLPDLGYSAAGRQAELLAPALMRLGHDVAVAALRGGGAFAAPLRGAGVTVHDLSSVHDLPMRAVFELDRLVRAERYELIHAWRMPSLRALGTLRLHRTQRPRVVVSEARRGGRWNPLDRMLGARADCVAADGGEPPAGRPSVPLAVGSVETSPLPLALPPGARVIMCLGRLTSEHGFRDAIWGFDVLKHVYPNIWLVVVGDGPERDKLHRFAAALGSDDMRIQFLWDGRCGPAYLPNAEIVWVPSRRPCGLQVVLEAQAAGVAVVASRFPAIEVLITHLQTGVLVKAGNAVELAKATRPWLDSPSARAELARAGQEAASAGRNPDEVAAAWVKVYQETLGRTVATMRSL